MVGPYRRGRMKRVTLASALTIAGVLSAGAAAALVNTRVLESAGGVERLPSDPEALLGCGGGGHRRQSDEEPDGE
jgi:hypothetical protein